MAIPATTVEVILEAGGDSNPLAVTVAELLGRNAPRSGRSGPLAVLSFDAVVEVRDAGADARACTVSFQGRRIRVYPFPKERCDVRLSVDRSALLRLASLPICSGRLLPWTRAAAGAARLLARPGVASGSFPRLVQLLQALSVEERTCPFVGR